MFLAELIDGCLYFVARYQKKDLAKLDARRATTLPQMNTIFSGNQKKYTIKIILTILGLRAIDLLASIINYVRLYSLKSIYLSS